MWIKVEEKLPHHAQGVLFVYEAHSTVGTYDAKEGWYNHLSGEYEEDVTHWQPIPDPPEEAFREKAREIVGRALVKAPISPLGE